MQYKTIILEMIQDRPAFYEELRGSKRLLPSLETYAMELRAAHQAWQANLAERWPGSDPRQIASEAMELAIAEMAERLPSGPSQPEG